MAERIRNNVRSDEKVGAFDGIYYPVPEIEKRRDERFDLRGEFTAEFRPEGGGAAHRALGRDLSLRGVRLESEVPVKVGSQIDLTILLPKVFPGLSSVPLKAEVVRCLKPRGEKHYKIGCEIIHLTRATEGSLFEYLWWSYSEKYGEVLAEKES